MSRSAVLLPILLFLSLLTATHGGAQELNMLAGLFKNVHSITVYYHAAALRESSEVSDRRNGCGPLSLCGAGSEVLIDLTEGEGAHLELGLAAGYLAGLGAREPSLDLRGSLRSFPTVSAYLTGIDVLPTPALQPYVGLSFGISELWNAQAYDPTGLKFGVKGQTFDYGATAGVFVESRRVKGLFAEVAYRVRRFGSVEWTLPAGTTRLPEGWPRTLDASGWSVSLGWQFDVQGDGHDHAAGPPAVTGTWVLARLDGQALPALLMQEPLAAGGSAKEELLAGTLALEEGVPGRYRLDLLVRTTGMDAAGKTVSVPAPARRVEAGTWSVEGDGALRLAPDGGAAAYRATRLEGDLLVQGAVGGHLLALRKAKE